MLGNDITLAGKGSTGTGRFSAANFRGARRVAVVLTVEAVGATPTMTFTVQGSLDGATWTDIAYLKLDSTVATSKAAITVSATGRTELFLDGLDRRFFEYVAVNVSANTNVTFDAVAYEQD